MATCPQCNGTGHKPCSVCSRWDKQYPNWRTEYQYKCNYCRGTGFEDCWQCRSSGRVRDDMPPPMDTAEFNRLMRKKIELERQPSRTNEMHGYTITKSNISTPSRMFDRGMDEETRDWLIELREKSRWERGR